MYVESDYPRERYQADTVYSTDYISNDTRYLLTMVDRFTKFGRVILTKYKKAETNSSAFKRWLASYLKPKFLHR